MIPLKSLEVPDVDRAVMRLTPEYLKSSERVLKCDLFQLSEEGGAYVAAEGSVFVQTFVTDVARLFLSDTAVFGLSSDSLLKPYPDGTIIDFYPRLVRAVVPYHSEEGELIHYIVADGRTYSLRGQFFRAVTEDIGGRCAAVHRERIFLGGGNTIRYCAPFKSDEWEITQEETGRIDLTSSGGEILALISFNGNLFCFREHEILRIRADAAELNYRIERIPFDGGNVLANSVRDCGSHIVFFTTRGLAVCDGTSCKIVRPTSDFTFPSGVHTGAWMGRYYAAVSVEGEGPCIYVYDPTHKSEHFVRAEATALAGGKDGLYYGHGTSLMRLTDRGFHENSAKEARLAVEIEIAGGDGSARYLDGVTVFGKGNFKVQFATEAGSCCVYARGNAFTPLPRVLRGTRLLLSIQSKEQGVAIKSCNLHFREVKA
ncbi:MAG: hypothetical protein IKD43_01630 [Clostridia bacterium]|nr:hypothetical protein [Clostridia bacterium]